MAKTYFLQSNHSQKWQFHVSRHLGEMWFHFGSPRLSCTQIQSSGDLMGFIFKTGPSSSHYIHCLPWSLTHWALLCPSAAIHSPQRNLNVRWYDTGVLPPSSLPAYHLAPKKLTSLLWQGPKISPLFPWLYLLWFPCSPAGSCHFSNISLLAFCSLNMPSMHLPRAFAFASDWDALPPDIPISLSSFTSCLFIRVHPWLPNKR